MQPAVLLATAAAVAVLMLSLWIVSVRIKDASIVDIFWGLGFVVIAWVARLTSDATTTDNLRRNVIVACVTIWGLRLAGYLYWRNHGKGEDYRYRAMRKKFGDRFARVSLVSVFGLQGLFMWIVSQPAQLGTMVTKPSGLGVVGTIGLGVWAIGMFFETVGDLQLARFKADPSNAGTVMDRGLWSWTRHPNYFGDFCVWWGIFLISVRPGGVTLLGVVGPVLMSFLLLRVSGVAMLEKTIGRRRAGYAEYVARTSAFFPRPPKR